MVKTLVSPLVTVNTEVNHVKVSLAQVKLAPAPLTFGSIAGAPELLETQETY